MSVLIADFDNRTGDDLFDGTLEQALLAAERALGPNDGFALGFYLSTFDPVYGARPLKRVIQQQLENPLSMAILKGEFAQGQTIQFSRNGEEDKLSLQL